ncbi:MAG: N-succinylarginine dihydrolase [Sphingopyxis sp.]
MLTEINFDGIIGPTHNYAGLSPGNIASAGHAGAVSKPRAAALQGLAKMRTNVDLGLAQGWLMPPIRPNQGWLQHLGTTLDEAEPHIRAAAYSASSMWAANAATVSPAADCADGRVHLTVANLMTMPHRAHEWHDTLAQLRLAFANPAFVVHAPIPAPFGDEGAANHMRLAPAHGDPGVEIFVYGISGGAFPARQHSEASKAVARQHGLDTARTLFIEQNPAAIAAGAFHNDVVAVANERVLLVHERAFAEREAAYAAIRNAAPWAEIVEVSEAEVPLADAITSYLFNAQLVSLPTGEMALIAPTEALATPSVARWCDAHIAGNGPIRRVIPVDVRQSMANGGGPACLRLRVVADTETVDPRFLCTHAMIDRACEVVTRYWPEAIAPGDLVSPELLTTAMTAQQALASAFNLNPR